MRYSAILVLVLTWSLSGCLKDLDFENENYFTDPDNADFFIINDFFDFGSNGTFRTYGVSFEFDESKFPPGVLASSGTLRYVFYVDGVPVVTLPGTATSVNLVLPVGERSCITGAFRIDQGTTPQSSQEFCIDVP